MQSCCYNHFVLKNYSAKQQHSGCTSLILRRKHKYPYFTLVNVTKNNSPHGQQVAPCIHILYEQNMKKEVLCLLLWDLYIYTHWNKHYYILQVSGDSDPTSKNHLSCKNSSQRLETRMSSALCRLVGNSFEVLSTRFFCLWRFD